MAWLLRASPYDEGTAGIVELYFSDTGFVTQPGDTPANIYWVKRLQVPLAVQQALYAGSDLGGRSDLNLGAITLANGDGALDELAQYDWDGRLVEVLNNPNMDNNNDQQYRHSQ